MPTYPVTFATGRSRTLTLTKALSCPFNWGIDNQLLAAGANGGGSFQAHLDPANPTAVWTAEAHIAPPKFNPGDSAYYCVASTQVPGQAVNRVEVGVGTNPTATVITSSGSLSATLTLVCPVVEYCTIYRLQDVYATASPPPFIVVDGRGFPDYSGIFPGLCPGGYPDGLEAIGIQFYEVCKSGSSVVVTSSNGPAVSSETWVCSADFQVDYVITDISGASANCLGNPAGYDVIGSCSTTLTATTDWNGSQFGGSGTYTNTESYGSVTTSDIGGHSISVSATLDGYHDTSVVSHISEGWAPPLLYKTNLKTQYFGTGATLTVDAEVAPAVAVQNIGSGTTITQLRQGGTIDQHFHSDPPSSDFDFPYDIPVLAQWTPVRFWLDEPALTASGDDIRDWRMMFCGKHWNSFTIAQASPLSVLAAKSFSSSSGTYTPTVTNWQGYRYLQFTCDQNGTVTVTTPQGLTKLWSFTVTTPGTAQTITLDLCSPSSWNQDSNVLPDVDTRKSYFPLASGASYPDETGQASSTDSNGFHLDAKGAYWGVFNVTSLTLTKLGGFTIHFGAMSLIIEPVVGIGIEQAESITMLPKFATYNTKQVGQPDLIMPFAYLGTNDKMVEDFPALDHVPGIGWSDYSLSNLASAIGAVPGFTTVEAGSFPDAAFDNNSGPSLWAGGSGAWWGGNAWHDMIDLDRSGTYQVVAQALFDEISTYPGAGDVFSGGAYDPAHPATPLNSAKFIRARAQGRVFNSSTKKPFPGADVVTFLTSNPATSYGSASTSSDGFYKTGIPYGPGAEAITTQLHQGETPYRAESSTWQNRQLVFDSFSGPATVAKGCGYDVSNNYRHVRTYCRASTGTFFLGISANQPLYNWNDTDSGISATYALVRYRDSGDDQPIGVLYSDANLPSASGSIEFVQTKDEGKTYGSPMTIATGTYFDFDEGRNGLRWFFWIEGTGPYNLFGSVLDAGLNVVRGRTATTITGLDNAPIAVRESVGNGGQWRIGVLYSLGGSLNVKYSEDGVSFT